MAENLTFTIKRGDLLPAYRARTLDKDATTPVNLNTATSVLLIMRGPVTVTGAMTKEDQTSNTGWVNRDWVSGDTDIVGNYRAEIEVTWAGGKKQTFPAYGYALVVISDDLD